MSCTHDLIEREDAVHDGQCSLCTNAELERLRAALEKAVGKLSIRLDERLTLEKTMEIREGLIEALAPSSKGTEGKP